MYCMNQKEDTNYHFFPEKGAIQINRVYKLLTILCYKGSLMNRDSPGTRMLASLERPRHMTSKSYEKIGVKVPLTFRAIVITRCGDVSCTVTSIESSLNP